MITSVSMTLPSDLLSEYILVVGALLRAVGSFSSLYTLGATSDPFAGTFVFEEEEGTAEEEEEEDEDDES